MALHRLLLTPGLPFGASGGGSLTGTPAATDLIVARLSDRHGGGAGGGIGQSQVGSTIDTGLEFGSGIGSGRATAGKLDGGPQVD